MACEVEGGVARIMSCTVSRSVLARGSGSVTTCVTGERVILVAGSESDSEELGSSVSESVTTCVTGERIILVGGSESDSEELGSSVSETSGDSGPTTILSGTGSRVGMKGILLFFLEDDFALEDDLVLEDDLDFLLLFKAGFLLCLILLPDFCTWETDLICLGGEEASEGMSSSIEVSHSSSLISMSEMLPAT